MSTTPIASGGTPTAPPTPAVGATASHTNVCRVAFTVTVRPHTLKHIGNVEGAQAIGVVVVDAASSFDAAKAVVIPLVTKASHAPTPSPTASTTASSLASPGAVTPLPSPASSTTWHTSKPLLHARGVALKYKYAIISSATGAFISWEKLPGTAEHRSCICSGKSVTMEDTFGEMDDERIQRQLDHAAEESRHGDDARAAAVSARLVELFGPGRRLLLVTYSLPVILRRSRRTGAWTATWIQDDFLARTENSIAYDVPTVWVGVVTRESIDLSTWEEAKRPARSASVCSDSDALPTQMDAEEDAEHMHSPAPESPPLRASSDPHDNVPAIIHSLTAGGVDLSTAATIHETAPLGDDATAAASPPHVYLPPSTSAPALRSPVSARTAASAAAPDGSAAASGRSSDAVTVSFSKRDMAEITRVLNSMNVIPIFLPSDLHEGFARYCLSVLKPCMHNVLETGAQHLFPYASSLSYLSEGWQQFVRTNELIAEVLFARYRAGDVVWLNDYQLAMVPRAMRQRCEAAGLPRPPQVFFMHSPFPTSEIFRTLAVRDDLLEAMLECDVVGFHTFNYARHFLQSAKRLLGVNFQSRRGGSLALDVDGRDVMVSISHVGVEAKALDRWMASEQAASVARAFSLRYPGKVIIAGIDTCQRLSGVALKLLAFERLLEDNPVYRKKVVLVQRCELRQALTADIKQTSQELQERVARIRATYGDVIDYEEAASFSPTYRVGLFHCADVFLQTPIREGLNLLPLEYVYVRTKWHMQRSKQHAAVSAEVEATAREGDHTPSVQSTGGGDSPAPSPALPVVHAVSGSTAGEEGTGAAMHRAQSLREARTRSLLLPPLAAGDSSPGGDSGQEQLGSPDSGLTDATIKAMTQGMPRYYAYATLGAAPSALRQKARTPLSSIFRGADAAPPSLPSSSGPAGVRSRSVSPPHSTTSEPAGARSTLPARPDAPASTRSEPVPSAGSAALLSPATATIASSSASSSPAATAALGSPSKSVYVTAEIPIPVCDAPLTAPLPPPPRGGCVVLSEFSTAAQILNSNLVVNPWNIVSVAREMDKALLMTDAERAFRQWRDYQYAVRNPAASWSRQVIADAVETYKLRGAEEADSVVSDVNSTPHAASTFTFADLPPAMSLDSAAPRASGSMAAGSALRDATETPRATPSTIITLAAATSSARASPRLEAAPLLSASAAHMGRELSLRSGMRDAAPGPSRLVLPPLVAAFKSARKRALFLDYGGTIMVRERVFTGRSARTDFTIDGYSRHMPSEVVDALAALSNDPNTYVYIVSGLRAAAIEALHLSRLPRIGLAAENGTLISHPPSHHDTSADALRFELRDALGTPTPTPHADEPSAAWSSMGTVSPPVSVAHASASAHSHSQRRMHTSGSAHSHGFADSSRRLTGRFGSISIPGHGNSARAWQSLMHANDTDAQEWAHVKERAVSIMTEYTWRVNGSQVRVYDSLIAWDFRHADAEFASAQAKFVASDCESLSSHRVKVSLRKTRVEVCLRSMNKGKFIAEVLRRMPAAEQPDFVLVAGDDSTDEEMFAAAHALREAPDATTGLPVDAPGVRSPIHVVSILVGRTGQPSAADYAVPDVAAMQQCIMALGSGLRDAAAPATVVVSSASAT